MVKSAATTVDVWLDGLEPARRDVFAAIRDLARTHLPMASEAMRYGMPCYARPDDQAPCFAYQSQKAHLALYILPVVHALHASAIMGVDTGKSCIRFRKAEAIDLDLVRRMLADTHALPPVNYGKA